MTKIRKYGTGATRDTAKGKYDYEGFFNPLAMYRFAKYMHKHRFQADGQMRDADNWQKGIPKKDYIKCYKRHDIDFWSLHRGLFVYKERINGEEITHIFYKKPKTIPENWEEVNMQDALCAIIFNTLGYLLELLKEE